MWAVHGQYLVSMWLVRGRYVVGKAVSMWLVEAVSMWVVHGQYVVGVWLVKAVSM